LFKNKPNIKLHYIKAHTEKTDVHSQGNAEADRLANLAVGCVKNTDHIIKLDICYFDKEKAKELGAKWNKEQKYWYVNKSKTSNENINELLSMKELSSQKGCKIDETRKVYINISYANKDKAKKLGAHWDASMKSWYYVETLISEEKKQLLNQLCNS
jgi:hypothetical protein